MSPGLSGVLSALEHVERRRILTELARTNEPVPVPIDAAILGSESAAAEIRLDVLHYHLPALEEHDYVRFDEDEHVVTRGPRFGEIRPYLGMSNGHGYADDSVQHVE